ncbi:SAM-dependent methyltransferase [Streptomyces sp. BE147]|uniref:SAM-dependent methyltransferase n=1 Tax=unclassified Streptomyces TaxID=2593676 RepID=UPI002E77CC98|nr:SAM-dependent methyltransferase [Streptomyces sp. BE147]MEE1736574.1 SAM-dependent methyltransferase [Streptomyces sp. BE147]
MQADDRLPYGVDVRTPSVARMYDHLLDGKDNFAADRAACDDLLRQVPSMKLLALNNRAFLRRVVHSLAQDYGIRQFIDHGSGLPTQDNVHQIAQRVRPASRVVYVDTDPIVRTVGGALLETDERTAVLQADMRDTEAIFESEQVARLIDLREPVAALFVSVLHCIPDADRPQELIRRVRSRLASGSIMVICQLVSESAEVRDGVSDFMDRETHGHWGRVRTRADVDAYFRENDLGILEPGLVEVSRWRPLATADAPAQSSFEWEEFGGAGVVR